MSDPLTLEELIKLSWLVPEWRYTDVDMISGVREDAWGEYYDSHIPIMGYQGSIEGVTLSLQILPDRRIAIYACEQQTNDTLNDWIVAPNDTPMQQLYLELGRGRVYRPQEKLTREQVLRKVRQLLQKSEGAE